MVHYDLIFMYNVKIKVLFLVLGYSVGLETYVWKIFLSLFNYVATLVNTQSSFWHSVLEWNKRLKCLNRGADMSTDFIGILPKG